jgi:hypothetical protein
MRQFDTVHVDEGFCSAWVRTSDVWGLQGKNGKRRTRSASAGRSSTVGGPARRRRSLSAPRLQSRKGSTEAAGGGSDAATGDANRGWKESDKQRRRREIMDEILTEQVTPAGPHNLRRLQYALYQCQYNPVGMMGAYLGVSGQGLL